MEKGFLSLLELESVENNTDQEKNMPLSVVVLVSSIGIGCWAGSMESPVKNMKFMHCKAAILKSIIKLKILSGRWMCVRFVKDHSQSTKRW